MTKRTLIIKLNATGDVVRTTPLLSQFTGEVTWITASRNLPLLRGTSALFRCLPWEERSFALDREYDLVINLEDEEEVARFASSVVSDRLFGAFASDAGSVAYTPDSAPWFDLSLISRFGRERADALKYHNRRSYQELLFDGLGWRFEGQSYLLPPATSSTLRGDVAIAPVAGPVWPMKGWDHYGELRFELERLGFVVNVLPQRPSILEHMADISSHRCVVCGDSLPMHLALGLGVRCVALFNCTSPWEIYDYGLLEKIVSPVLGEFFYKRGMDRRATAAIDLQCVLNKTVTCLQK